ncbi:MAG: hypothetical protein JST89_24270 [Cyanobacteria bacterium SZAS-4]|nr:hypothetical protein [Cyanobacteria bacterium SZAS-4]
MSFAQFFQLHNEVSDRPTADRTALTHIDVAQQEVETERKTSKNFTANSDQSLSQLEDTRLPSSNITDGGFVFAPALKSAREHILEAFKTHPEDSSDKHEYYRTGLTGELYAHDKDGERLLTSSNSNSTLIQRTLNNIRGFTDKFQFTASNDAGHKALSFHTLFGDVSVERAADGSFHVDFGDKDGSNLILKTQNELQNFVSRLNGLLKLQPKSKTNHGDATAAIQGGAENFVGQSAGAEDLAETNSATKADTVAIDFNTGIATITGGDQKNVQYDFNSGDLGVGGFELGHFVFQNGTTILSNGDVVGSSGTLTTYAEILAHLTPAERSVTANQAESNAPSLAASILAKAGSEPISQAEIVALMSLDSSLAAVESSLTAISPTLSLARTAIAMALAAALLSQKPKAQEESAPAITFDSPYTQTSYSIKNSLPQQFH